jgi:hypothetical protein
VASSTSAASSASPSRSSSPSASTSPSRGEVPVSGAGRSLRLSCEKAVVTVSPLLADSAQLRAIVLAVQKRRDSPVWATIGR